MNFSSDFALSLIFHIQVCPCDAEMLGQPVPQSISNVEAQKCPICLDIFKTQEIGIPDTCKHIFCCSCLQQWSKVIITLI
jgi:hypothetical protein